MRDFTVEAYLTLLDTIRNTHTIVRYDNYTSAPPQGNVCIMRHDIDSDAFFAEQMAKLEYDKGIKSSYYFRINRKVFQPDRIKSIYSMGHEIGYHYENLSTISSAVDTERACDIGIKDFCSKIAMFRRLVPINTMTMHGSPFSKWDNRILWKYYNYRDYGIIGEPYFDLDFDSVLYITDASRSWKSDESNKRDRVNSIYSFNFNSVFDIINSLKSQSLPTTILLNVHPELWSDNMMRWWKIKLIRTAKNIVKRNINRQSMFR